MIAWNIFSSICLVSCAFLSLCYGIQKSEDCFQRVATIFGYEESNFTTFCGQVGQVLQCADETFLQAAFHQSRDEITAQLCDVEIIYPFLNQRRCIQQHLTRLAACVARAWSLSRPEGDSSHVLQCKRVQHALKCPEEILDPPCKKETTEAVEDIFLVFLGQLMRDYCEGVSSHQWNDLTADPTFGNGYKRTAECMDGHQASVAGCLKNSIRNRTMNRYFCNPSNAMESCVRSSLKNNCSLPSDSTGILEAFLSALGIIQCPKKAFQPHSDFKQFYPRATTKSYYSRKINAETLTDLHKEVLNDQHEDSSDEVRSRHNDSVFFKTRYPKKETEIQKFIEKSPIAINSRGETTFLSAVTFVLFVINLVFVIR